MTTLHLEPGQTLDRLRLVASHVPERMPFDRDDTPQVVWWKCVCACGNDTTTTERKLLDGTATACYDCMKGSGKREQRRIAQRRMSKVNGVPIRDVEDYTPTAGDKFGELELVEQVDEQRWKMKCDCGELVTLRIKIVTAKSKAVRRCGHCTGRMAEQEQQPVSAQY